MTPRAFGVLACLLATPLRAQPDTVLESVGVRCGDGRDARCALRLEFSQPVHLGRSRFAIRASARSALVSARAFALDPRRSTTVYLPLPRGSRGAWGVRWSVRSVDGLQLLRSEDHAVARGVTP